MKTFKTYKVLNAALENVSGDAFRTLYYICNNLSLNKTIRTEIDRVSIAIKLGLWFDGCSKRLDFQLKKITKYTEELTEKGYLVKDVIFDKTTNKRKVFYAIPDTFVEEQLSNNVQKLNDNCKKTYPTKKDQNNEKIKSIKSEKEELEFCEAELNEGDDDDKYLPF